MDPGWNGGEYVSNADVEAGLKRQAHIWGVVGFSTEFWKQEVWRVLEFQTREEFIDGFLEPYFTVLDPNDLLTQSWKWQRGDVARHTGGDLAAALGRITARTFVMPIDEDLLFPVRTAAGAAADQEQRTSGGRGRARAPGPVRRQPGLLAADRPPPGRPARRRGLTGSCLGPARPIRHRRDAYRG